MIVSTTWNVAGHRVVETKGEVFGLIVRTRSLPMNIAAGVRSLFGGMMTAEIVAYGTAAVIEPVAAGNDVPAMPS
jgi:uncharacterized protein YbjQ (UPF0145 family)